MKYNFLIVVFLTSFSVLAQNITVDSQTYTAQQLIENILINSSCISDVIVTNVVGGDFNNTDQSFGYFNGAGTSFPFQNGLVLSTGKLKNTEGPNNRLSDDDAPGWIGDADLENVLNESNTVNATIIEFDFTAITNQISFNYIFASEEYQENDANTCRYSDLFGFLIRPINEVDYTNIALVPNTETPVKVTTVHPTIPGGCAAQNEAYFGSWNGSTAPINFNGQTKVLTAKATIIPNETYHVKLVIADEQNYRYDSAVFLQAGSFESSTDLGQDKLIDTKNPVCFNEYLELNAFTSGNNNSYKWFKNKVELPLETNSTFTVTEAGVYNVEVTLGSGCISYGEINIEYAKDLETNQNYLRLCDDDDDGLTFFDLHLADPFYKVDMTGLTVVDYFLNEDAAADNLDAIVDQSVFFNTKPNQVVYARIENEFGCYEVQPLTLDSGTSYLNFSEFNACDSDLDGKAIFDLNELRNLIKPEVSSPANVTFFASYNDAAYHQNPLPDDYENTTPNSQEIWVKAQDIYCELLTTIYLKTVNKPQLQVDAKQFYCLNTYPETIVLEAGVINSTSTTNYYEWFKNDLDLAINRPTIEVNEVGNYKVIVSIAEGCASERTIVVQASESAIIENILIEETNNRNSVTVQISGIGEYEFSLDDNASGFQESNVFLNVSSGSHTVYVQDINGCTTVEESIIIRGFPNFFTPNNDGFNDTWKPIGIDENFNAKIHIFDRYGKLLIQLNPFGNGWDGLINGSVMPSSDYWYKISYENGEIIKGHFTLKR